MEFYLWCIVLIYLFLLPSVDVAGLFRSAQLNPSRVQAVWMLLDTPQKGSQPFHPRCPLVVHLIQTFEVHDSHHANPNEGH